MNTIPPAIPEELFQQAVTLHQSGRLAEAVIAYDRAVALRPDWVEALHNRGLALSGLQRWGEACASFTRALAVQPELAPACNERGLALYALGRHDEALSDYDRALALQPGYADALINRGVALAGMQRPEEALTSYDRALALQPGRVLALSNRGNVLQEMNRPEDALASYDRALALDPACVAALNNRGVVLHAMQRFDEAVASYERALGLRPDYAEALRNLGLVRLKQGKPDAAEACFRQALALNPAYARAHANLGTALLQQNKPDEAGRCFGQALVLQPDYAEAYSDSLLALLYRSSVTPAALLAAHRAYADRFEAPLRPQWPRHVPAHTARRRLKVGYVSADFRRHSVAYFIEPVLAHHDRSRVEVYCYYNHTQHDMLTERIATAADHWLVCKGLSDSRLAERIRADGIDILVDLGGHTGDSRLLTFARKPAPVQVSYLGYAATTGLSAIDYRLGHYDIDPPGSEAHYSETLYRLPRSLWCYRPPDGMPPVQDVAPAVDNGFITFGSMNNLAKLSPATLVLWAEILRQVPTARLVMTNVPEGSARRGLEEYFVAAGIAAERLSLEGRLPDAEFWTRLHGIDIALDPFPYTGTTTTCESLWMGVPVVTLAGATCVARSGYALLKAVGLEDLVAADPAGYVAIAVRLARDIPRLGSLRAGLCPRIAASALRDEAGLARALEDAYREMWQQWYDKQKFQP